MKYLRFRARFAFSAYAQNQFSGEIEEIHSAQGDFLCHQLLGEALHCDIVII